MKARELFDAGKLNNAIESLGVELRNDPTDAQRRVFLFELLSFAGQFDRAEKQLNILAEAGPDAMMGTLVYRSALHAERVRAKMFETGDFPQGDGRPSPASGTLNGKRFDSLTDGDPRIGPRLEVFAAGQYTWIPWQYISSVTLEPPQRLRDLLWAPAVVRVGPDFKGVELGEVLLPVMTPLSWKHPDDEVRLGRVTEWQLLENGEQAPAGQKLLIVDDEAYPILELRHLEIASASESD